MKRSLAFPLLAGAMLLSACETAIVARRPVAHRRVVFTERVANDRVIYRDSAPTYRRSYYEDDVTYRVHRDTNRDFPRRSLDRTYAF